MSKRCTTLSFRPQPPTLDNLPHVRLRPSRTLATALLVTTLGVAGCTADQAPGRKAAGSPGSDGTSGTDGAATDADAPLAWGPTAGELDQARELVREWTPARLAGQVIVGRYQGIDPAQVAALVKDLHLAGVSVTSDNIVDEAQVRATTAAVTAAVAADGRTFPPVLGVDQEGGYVSHLSGIATSFPPFAAAGEALQADDRTGRAIIREAAAATGLELRELGFTWVFAPVGDVTIGAADPTIGTRSPSDSPLIAAHATAAAVRGYDDVGIVSTTKHFPGHGSVTVDSHEALPVLEASMKEIRSHDLPPFEAAIAAHAPAIMLGHIDVQAIAAGEPASLAPRMYDFLREDLGFDGVAITDSLGMGAVATSGFPAVRALNAGADLLLMPVDTRVTHGLVAKAIKSGRIPRERAEEAAANVVAVQLWQARVAAQVAVPDDVSARAQQAAQALLDAGN